MTTVRTHGFDSSAQLREYMLDLEDESMETAQEDDGFEPSDTVSALRQIGWLRKEVADLSNDAVALRELKARIRVKQAAAQSSPRLALVVAATFAVGGAVQIWRARH
jgi:hypothetical protein